MLAPSLNFKPCHSAISWNVLVFPRYFTCLINVAVATPCRSLEFTLTPFFSENRYSFYLKGTTTACAVARSENIYGF